jgi:ABC-type polar amino acid transport system ATPase subunit
MSVVCSVKNLKKRFGASEIVKGVSFDVHEGEVLGLVGSSGAGKSTILRCLNYLTPFEEGEIDLAGHKLRPGMTITEPAVRAARRDAGMVFQDFQLFPHLTARENVALGPRRVLGVGEAAALARADKLLDRVQLGEKRTLYPAQLSGGQRQRVGIARALAMEPKLMLLDEPTSALDPELKEEVARVILDLKKDGMTMVLVTHEMELARTAANRVIRLKFGKIDAEGTPAQVL